MDQNGVYLHCLTGINSLCVHGFWMRLVHITNFTFVFFHQKLQERPNNSSFSIAELSISVYANKTQLQIKYTSEWCKAISQLTYQESLKTLTSLSVHLKNCHYWSILKRNQQQADTSENTLVVIAHYPVIPQIVSSDHEVLHHPTCPL